MTGGDQEFVDAIKREVRAAERDGKPCPYPIGNVGHYDCYVCEAFRQMEDENDDA